MSLNKKAADDVAADAAVAGPSRGSGTEAVPGPSGAAGMIHQSPCYPVAMIVPGGMAQIQRDATQSALADNGCLSPLVLPSTSRLGTPDPVSQEQSVAAGASMKRFRRRALKLSDRDIKACLRLESGSEWDSGESEEDDVPKVPNQPGTNVNRDRKRVKGKKRKEEDAWMVFDRIERMREGMDVEMAGMEELFDDEEEDVQADEDKQMQVESEGMNEDQGLPVNVDYVWSEDFTSFRGQKETYSRAPGTHPTSHPHPTDIFCHIWDREIMEMIVKQTNEYAWQVFSQLTDPELGTGIPTYMDFWTETSVEELYRYFAVLIYLSYCHRSKITEYWDTGVLEMPGFRKIISRNKFLLLNKFLHFVNNEDLVSSGYNRIILKVEPIVDHCNKRFSELYIPFQHLCLDESLLLWKGRLSWKQCIRSKAARFGIKTFELCEAETGYLLQYRLYTGKDTAMHPGPLHGFDDKTAKVVLQLMEGYLDAGHVLVMDNWYNQLPLTRYLKSRRTDVLGTISRRQRHIPPAIKDLDPNQLKRGETVARHCGDIALVAWRDVKLVTAVSTYHQHEMVPQRRAGQAIEKPAAVVEYNRYMGGVDRKDQKLSMFLIERKKNLKWYMKVFRRLFNTSLLNAYIIYLRNPMCGTYSHRQFRLRVAEGLLSRNLRESSVPSSVRNISNCVRLSPGQHFPVYNEPIGRPGKNKIKQLRCVRCSALKKRTEVTIRCELCQAPLCLGKCWRDYHTLKNL